MTRRYSRIRFVLVAFAATVVALTWLLASRPQSPSQPHPRSIGVAPAGTVVMFVATDWYGLNTFKIKARYDNQEPECVLFKPVVLGGPNESGTLHASVYRCNVVSGTVTSVPDELWDNAQTQIVQPGGNVVLGRFAGPEQPLAGAFAVEAVSCPDCPDLVAVLSADGPISKGSRLLGGGTIQGTHYLELRNKASKDLVGQPVTVPLSEEMWSGYWLPGCRHIVFTCGAGASTKIAIIAASALVGSPPCDTRTID